MQGWGGRVSASPLWDRLRERGCGWALTPLPGLRSIQGSRPGLSAASPDWAAFSFSDPRWDPGDLVGGWMVSGQAQSSGRSSSGACCPVRVPEAWACFPCSRTGCLSASPSACCPLCSVV